MQFSQFQIINNPVDAQYIGFTDFLNQHNIVNNDSCTQLLQNLENAVKNKHHHFQVNINNQLLHLKWENKRFWCYLEPIIFSEPKIVYTAAKSLNILKSDILLTDNMADVFDAEFLDKFKRSKRKYFSAIYQEKIYLFDVNGLIGMIN